MAGMDIHQLSVTYIREHDRILVRINTTAGEELRLWLTQRLLRGLYPHLGKAAANLEASRTPLADNSEQSKLLLAEFKKEETLQSADFKTPFKSSEPTLPLGDRPLLVTEVRMTAQGAGRLEIAFDEKLPDVAHPRGFKIAIQPQLMHGLLHLLQAAITASEWPISPLAPPNATEAASDTKRPRYLN